MVVSAGCFAHPALAAPQPTNITADIVAATSADDGANNALLSEPQKQPSDNAIPETLIYAFSLIGVKYRYGGKSADTGFDCSGFIRHVFAETLALALPHSSYAMSKLGNNIEKDGLQPGDLVFYRTLKHSFSHVGLYIGDGRFVHAPSRGKTVEIVDMDNAYWRKRFNGARRVISVSADNGASSPVADSSKPTADAFLDFAARTDSSLK